MDLLQFALDEAQRQGVDPGLVQRVFNAESGGNPYAVSPAGARGPMQLMPATARDLGVNIDDPIDNIRGGVKYLGQLSQQFGGDPRFVAAAYNAGPGATSQALARTGDIPNIPETRAYVQKVAGMGADINPNWLEPASGGASGTAQGAQAASPARPQAARINPDWLEPMAAASSAPAPTSAPADESMWDKAKRINASIASAFPNPFAQFGIGPGAGNTGTASLVNPQTNMLGQKVSNKNLMDPKVSAALRGVLLPVNLLDKYAITPLMRKIPESIGGNPNEPTLEDWMLANTRAPEGAVEQGATKVSGYIGNAVGAGKILKGAGSLANAVGLPRVGSFLTNAGTFTPGTAGGAVTGGAAADVTDMAADKMGLTPGARVAADTIAGVLGGWPGAALGNRLANGVAADTAATLAAAKSADVPTQLSDLSSTWANIKHLADKIPLSNAFTKSVPAQQVQGVRQALTDTAEGYRPAGLDATAGTSGTDRFIAADLRGQYNAAKTATKNAYDAVQQVMAQHPNLPNIDMSGTRQQVQSLLAEYPEAFRDLTLSNTAKKVLGVVDSGTAPKNSVILQANGQPFQKPAQISFQEARQLSSELWNLANQAQQSAVRGGTSQTQAGLLKKLAGAVGDDVSAYMAGAPQDVRNAYATADNTFKSTVLPFRQDPKVYGLVSSRTPQTDYDLAAQGIYNNLFNTSQGERSAMALQLMSPKGQQAAAYQALKDAADKGTSTVSPTGLKAGAASRALDVEGNPALANIAASYPPLAADADRLGRLLQLGRHAANEVAGQNAKTGFQNVHTGVAALMGGGGHALAERLGPALGYGIGVGGPIAGGNILNLINRLGPARYLLADPGTFGQRVMPGTVNGLLADPELSR